MKLYLYGIKSYQWDLGIKSTAFADPRLERTMQGINRDPNQPERWDRTPSTCPYFLRILQQLDTTQYNDVVI